MNFSAYDDKTRQLIEECERLSIIGDPKAMGKLRQLEKLAKEREDKGLLGYTYFYLANWNYDNSRLEQFYKDLKRAIQYLLISGEYEQLARAYNFFASDAQDNEVYDIAYSYYNNALSFIDEEKDIAVSGVILGNLGGLYYELGDYLKARGCFRKALHFIKKNSDDPFYYRNIVVCYINDGLNSLALGDISAAEKALKQTERAYKKIDDAFLGNGRFVYRFFEARLALVKGEWSNFYEKADEIIQAMAAEEEPHFYMVDIQDFCQMLIEKEQIAIAGRILETIRERVMNSGSDQAARLFMEVMVDYHERAGDEKKLAETLQKQQKYFLSQKEEQRKIYIHSLDLVNLVGKLQEEEERVRLENEILQIQVETDALTGIPNRYSMEKELESSLERSQRLEQPMAVVVMDIDDFKTYNDRYGHSEGDRCLEEVGDIMKDFFKEKPVFYARYGGDEFVMIYEGMDEKDVRASAKALGALVKSASSSGRMKREVTVSQGVCVGVPSPDTKPWDYMSLADEAMYKAKEDNKRNKDKKSGVSISRLLTKHKK